MARRKPINSGYIDNSFFDGSDLKMEVEWGRDYLNSDIPAMVHLYNVDYKSTKTHSLYGETKANEKVTSAPIVLSVRYQIVETETEYIANSTIARQYAGDLIFTVYEDELKEKNATIRRGDFIGVKNTKGSQQFYEVFDADYLNVSNSKTIAGLEAFYKRIRCRAVDKDVFKG